MRFEPVLFTKWNNDIFHSKWGHNQDPAFFHVFFIGQKVVLAYVFLGQFCLFPNLQFFTILIKINFLPKIYVANTIFIIHFHKLHAICFQMIPKTKYLVHIFSREARFNIVMSKSAGCRSGNLSRETIWASRQIPSHRPTT